MFPAGTNFALTGEQVDRLITIGGTLLHASPGFQELLADLKTAR